MDTPAIRRKTPAPYRRVFFYVIVKGEKNLSYHNVRQHEDAMKNPVETFMEKCAENNVCPGCINYVCCEEVPGGRHRMWAGVENPKGNNYEFIVRMHEVWEVIEWEQAAIVFRFPHITMTTL